jgi:cell division protein FtsI (penicillin-binding protein 3)
MREDDSKYQWRFYIILFILLLCLAALLWRLADLGIFNRTFLLKQSDARAMRIVSTSAYRGMITDRFGIPLAISTPMESPWVNPPMFQPSWSQLSKLAKLLGMRISDIKKRVDSDSDREFVYLRRGIPPELAEKIKALNIPGLFFLREYRRFYPESDVSAQVIGTTNVDDKGQEGLELAYDQWLRGIPGKERVIKDRLGHIIGIVNVISQPIQGRDLALSLDNRIQFIAYQNLKQVVQKFNAGSGSVIVLNPKTGEILAMVNMPSYNPNQRPLAPDSHHRNRAVTDTFEPGSTMKPFSIASALFSGKYTPDTKVDTNPGWLTLNGHTIHDVEADNGVLNVTQVLQKSSNIGVAKITLSLPPQDLINMLHKVGFGQITDSGFPGEENGRLVSQKRWSDIDIATISFGYGVAVTAMQLAHAYAMIANAGVSVPLTFLKEKTIPQGKQTLDPKIASEILSMLETVVQKGGTATQAAVPGYRIAGKTGTAYIARPGGYDKSHYTASFVGIVPVSNPQLVIVVVVNNVSGDIHMGGQISAPVFANIASAVLRILDIPPDNFSAAKN